MFNWSYYLINIFFVLLLVAFNQLAFDPAPEVDYYSLTAESMMAFTVLVLLNSLHQLKYTPTIYYSMRLGASLLMVALTTDALDELYLQAGWMTTLFEDFGQVLGFMVLLFGIIQWIQLNNDQRAHLNRLATTDELTGIAARRLFYQKANDEYQRCARNQGKLSLLMMDIDYFKTVNDTYGHQGGDEVLKSVAARIQAQTRQTDVFARWGGEEFVLMVVDSDDYQSAHIAEKMRTLVESYGVDYQGQTIQVTVSIGVATLRGTDTSIDTLLDRADKLLYQAKQSGRNRVEQDIYHRF